MRSGGETESLVKEEQVKYDKKSFSNGATSRVYKGMYTDANGKQYPVAVKEFVLQMTRRMQKKVDKEAKNSSNNETPKHFALSRTT